MKTTTFSAKTRKIFLGVITVMLMLPLACQAQKIPFVQSSVAPAAEGYVKISSDRNKNNIIAIRIKYMAKIDKLDPNMKTYVVWMVTDNESTINIGRINSSKNLDVSFDAVSSFRPIKIYITAEVDENTKVPGDKIVLTTNNFYK